MKNKGYVIVIATGRILRSAIDITDGAEFANYIVGDAGGLVYNMDEQTVILKNKISKENVKKICSIYNDDIEYIDMCNLDYYYKLTKFEYEDFDVVKLVNDIEEVLLLEDIIHMSVVLRNQDKLEEIYRHLKEIIFDLDFNIMQDSFSNNKWIEIAGRGITKYKGIKDSGIRKY